MMDNRKLAVLFAAILETLHETCKTSEDYAPEGVMYAGLMGEVGLMEFQNILGVLEKHGDIRRAKGHVVYITEQGRELARKCQAARASA
jgi:predicted transcriptional regulator